MLNGDIAEALDRKDREILAHLQNDGRLTNLELAAKVGLSPSPCLRRVRRLEASGVLNRYVALVDPAKLGLGVTAFVRVALSKQEDRSLQQFESAVAEWPEVMECYLMSGDSDYQLRLILPTLGDYETFLRQKLTRVPGVANIRSSFAFRPVVYRTELPIPA
jgi:Lrp/AsnC family leucine-responsive transcriptional regulator